MIVLLLVCGWAASLYLAYRAPRPGEPDEWARYRRNLGPVVTRAARSVVALDAEQLPSPGLTVAATGSGFIIDSAGLLLTNEHVVHDADVIRVTLPDKRRYLARLVGADPRTDLAVLQIDAQDLPPLELSPAERLEAGQLVIALGNPLGTGADGQPVATFGRISRLQQALASDLDPDNDRFYDDLIQSTAVALPGSSGGPLLDEQGRVVGINTAMGTSVETQRQFGFAIPFDARIRQIVNQLKQGAQVEHAFLGVDPVEMAPQAAQEFGLSDISGALVGGVLLGSPAQQAGLRPGDLIRGLNGERIYSPADLLGRLNRLEPGSDIQLEVLRPGQPAPRTLTITAALVARNLDDLKGYAEEARQDSFSAWGIEVKPLTDWRRRQLHLPPNQRGAVIYYLRDDSPGRSQNLQPGQVITALGPYPVDNLEDFAMLARKLPVLPKVQTAP